jgi:hypothetical protein
MQIGLTLVHHLQVIGSLLLVLEAATHLVVTLNPQGIFYVGVLRNLKRFKHIQVLIAVFLLLPGLQKCQSRTMILMFVTIDLGILNLLKEEWVVSTIVQIGLQDHVAVLSRQGSFLFLLFHL